MPNTISFTEKADGQLYTVAEVNALFDAIAAVLNNKLDTEEADTLEADVNIGGAKVLNLADAVDPADAVTYGQLLALVPEEE